MIENIFKQLIHMFCMKKKSLGILMGVLLLAFVLVLSFVAAAENSTNDTSSNTGNSVSSCNSNLESDAVNRGYQCLESLVNNNTKISLQEAVFASIALGNKNKLSDVIEEEKGQNCWPKSGCKLKDTAQVILAYDRMGKNTKDIESWVISKNSSATDLIWFLEIDVSNHVAAQCSIIYDGRESKISVNDDMKLSGNPGSCLSISSSGYWLRINDNCVNKEFEVSCNQDFLTSLLYQKREGSTIYVTSETHSASSLGTTIEKVNSYCFKTSSACDYEGSLWAALALSKTGNDISNYLPYLLALSEDNKKYFPSAFVNILTGGQDQYSEVVQNQKNNKYWEMIGSPYNRYYDTSLGLLSLQGSSAIEFENARNYLLEIQGKDGCWNNKNLRDTAFILYSGWPKSTGSSGSSGSGSSGAVTCESASLNYACSRASDCVEAGGSILYSYECNSYSEFCCSIKPQQETCNEKSGTICAANQQCSGSSVYSADGTCCIGTCHTLQSESTCESVYDGTCRFSCDDTEETITASCSDTTQICCTQKTTSGSGKGFSWLWIIFLLILIALIVLAIIYRDKIRLWWFKRRGKVKTSELRPGRGPPPIMPGRFGPSPRFGPGFNRSISQSTARPVSPPMRPGQNINRPRPPVESKSGKDKEVEDTFKKLKEMSK